LEKVVEEKYFKIVMDLSEVTYISSAGWGVFIEEIRVIQSSGGDLKLAGLRSEVEEIYKLLEFETILSVYGTVEEAVSTF
jgi:anti-anti-sigma factor